MAPFINKNIMAFLWFKTCLDWSLSCDIMNSLSLFSVMCVRYVWDVGVYLDSHYSPPSLIIVSIISQLFSHPPIMKSYHEVKCTQSLSEKKNKLYSVLACSGPVFGLCCTAVFWMNLFEWTFLFNLSYALGFFGGGWDRGLLGKHNIWPALDSLQG